MSNVMWKVGGLNPRVGTPQLKVVEWEGEPSQCFEGCMHLPSSQQELYLRR
jgi:hypothetical protein